MPGGEMDLFTYRPVSVSGLLFVFDGLHRNALDMRDKAAALAERTGLATFAPLMPRERFPKWRYDHAGVVRRGREQTRDEWTAPLLQALIDRARELTLLPTAPLYLLGHSAGGQLLSRLCAYSPLSQTQRIVITNPSSYVAPTLEEPAPFGFANLFTPAEAAARLQVYLALPVTFYLGREDTGVRHLSRSRAAMRQGASRLERGRRVYEQGRAMAARARWAFNWRLVEVPDVGHSSRAMLEAADCLDALGVRRVAPVAPIATARGARRNGG